MAFWKALLRRRFYRTLTVGLVAACASFIASWRLIEPNATAAQFFRLFTYAIDPIDPTSLIDPDQPTIAAWADRISIVEPDTTRRGMFIREVTRSLVKYATDLDAAGEIEYPMGPTELEFRRDAAGRAFWEGDCEDRAVVACSLAARMDVPYRILKGPGHVWAEVMVAGSWVSIISSGQPEAMPESPSWTPSNSAAFRDCLASNPAARDAFIALVQMPTFEDPTVESGNPDVVAVSRVATGAGGIAAALAWLVIYVIVRTPVRSGNASRETEV